MTSVRLSLAAKTPVMVTGGALDGPGVSAPSVTKAVRIKMVKRVVFIRIRVHLPMKDKPHQLPRRSICSSSCSNDIPEEDLHQGLHRAEAPRRFPRRHRRERLEAIESGEPP